MAILAWSVLLLPDCRTERLYDHNGMSHTPEGKNTASQPAKIHFSTQRNPKRICSSPLLKAWRAPSPRFTAAVCAWATPSLSASKEETTTWNSKFFEEFLKGAWNMAIYYSSSTLPPYYTFKTGKKGSCFSVLVNLMMVPHRILYK